LGHATNGTGHVIIRLLLTGGNIIMLEDVFDPLAKMTNTD